MTTLQELAVAYAQKQKKLVDAITESSPLFEVLPFEPSSHNAFHVAEEVTAVDSPSRVDLNASLSEITANTGITKVDMMILGGKILGLEDTVDNYPDGKAAYFRKKTIPIIREAAATAEYKILYDSFRAKAIDDGNKVNAGGSGSSLYSIIAVRFSEGECTGLYNKKVKKDGELITLKPYSGGNVYIDPTTGKNTYGMYFKAYFGVFQATENKHTAVIANIDSSNLPTENQLKEALRMVRAGKNTYLFMHQTVADMLSSSILSGKIVLPATAGGFDSRFKEFNGVKIVTTYNMLDGSESAVSF